MVAPTTCIGTCTKNGRTVLLLSIIFFSKKKKLHHENRNKLYHVKIHPITKEWQITIWNAFLPHWHLQKNAQNNNITNTIYPHWGKFFTTVFYQGLCFEHQPTSISSCIEPGPKLLPQNVNKYLPNITY